MSNTLKNVVSNGLVGSTASVGYGAIPSVTTGSGNVTLNGGSHIYTTSTTSLGGGSSGQFLTSGSNGTSWANPNDNVMIVKNSPAELEVKGRVKINGRDLEERLDIIEKVLAIPERDVILEQQHPKLKKLFNEYIAALEKYKTFGRIKGTYDK
jgi:hypothetical protein